MHMTTLCQDIINQKYKIKGCGVIYLIYKYTNKINGKVYIGQTHTTLEQRAQSNGHNYISSPKFYKAIQKYGWENFIPTIIETVETQDKANECEMLYIAIYRNVEDEFGYNISLGGQSGAITKDVKKKISEKAKERYKDKSKNPMFGRRHSDESKVKMSNAHTGEKNPMYGKTWTETQRLFSGTKGKKLNLTEAQRDILRNNARKLGKEVGLRPVRCIEDNLTFESITSAANVYSVTKSTLTGHLKGRQLSCANKHFEYLD